MFFFFFFFSSRRRHTRFSRDWSSDVCSSDLRQRDAVFVIGRLRTPRPAVDAPVPPSDNDQSSTTTPDDSLFAVVTENSRASECEDGCANASSQSSCPGVRNDNLGTTLASSRRGGANGKGIVLVVVGDSRKLGDRRMWRGASERRR